MLLTKEITDFIEIISGMTGKEYTELKKRLLEECQKVQMKVVESSKEAMNEVQIALNEYGPNKDRYDSFRDQLIGKRDMFATQYQKALTEYSVLEKIEPRNVNECVEFGAVIITDTARFFISISAGKICVDDQLYYAISPMVPLFKAMEGLKKENTFYFNGKIQTIKEIF